MRYCVLLFLTDFCQRRMIWRIIEDRIIAKALLPADLRCDLSANDPGKHMFAAIFGHITDGTDELCAPLLILHLIDDVLILGRIIRIISQKTGRIHARSAIHRIDRQTGIIRDDRRMQPLMDRTRQAKMGFILAMDDDFNTADAVSAIFELVRQINTDCDRNPLPSKEYFTYTQALFDTLLDVMGIVIPQQQEEQLPAQVQELVERRAQARKEKNFALADQLRDEIAALGYEVKETRQGTQITKK